MPHVSAPRGRARVVDQCRAPDPAVRYVHRYRRAQLRCSETRLFPVRVVVCILSDVIRQFVCRYDVVYAITIFDNHLPRVCEQDRAERSPAACRPVSDRRLLYGPATPVREVRNQLGGRRPDYPPAILVISRESAAALLRTGIRNAPKNAPAPRRGGGDVGSGSSAAIVRRIFDDGCSACGRTGDRGAAAIRE